MKLIPLLLLVVIACWTQATIFEASGVVQCDLPGQTWCSDIRIYEIDVFNDDVVAVTGKQCTSNKSRKYQLEGEEDGDGLWDKYYEAALRVRHNCSNDGLLHDLWKYEYRHPISIKRISVEWSPVLTDKGMSSF